MSIRNLVIVGVGGQGALLTGRILGELALAKDWDVKISEVHGMAQRGGSVITHVRFGEREIVRAPLVNQGESDVILAFEPLEALRALPFLRPGGVMIVNTRIVPPMTTLTGEALYPPDITATIREKANCVALDAQALAEAQGAPRGANLALLGVLASRWDIALEDWFAAITTCVTRTLSENRAAFQAGYEAGRNAS